MSEEVRRHLRVAPRAQLRTPGERELRSARPSARPTRAAAGRSEVQEGWSMLCLVDRSRSTGRVVDFFYLVHRSIVGGLIGCLTD